MTANIELAQPKPLDGNRAMADGERQQAFIQALQEAERKYGFTVVSTIQVEGLGPVTTLGPSPIQPGPVSIVAVEGWQEIDPNQDSKKM